MKKNWIRKLIGGLSVTSALFVFQACYGTPQDFGLDLLLEGQVKSKAGVPVKGVKVSIAENGQYELTNEAGEFSIYTEMLDVLTVKFEDIDSITNGYFVNRDTLLKGQYEDVYLDITLDEK